MTGVRGVRDPAEHAAPAHLAIRDWLLVALSFSTGVYEVICFLSGAPGWGVAMATAADTDALIKHILLEERRRFGLDAPGRPAAGLPDLGAGRGQEAGRR
jgi:hypothetical protein